jgi:hypothetical protein
MQSLELGHSPRRVPARFDDTLRLALLVSFPVIGLDQFLHTSPAALLTSPLDQSLRWVSGALLALPLAAAAVWAGQWIANRSGRGPDRVWGRLRVLVCDRIVAGSAAGAGMVRARRSNWADPEPGRGFRSLA